MKKFNERKQNLRIIDIDAERFSVPDSRKRVMAYSKLISLRDAANRLGVSYSTVNRMLGRGDIGCVRFGKGHPRIKESEIERLLGNTRPVTTFAKGNQLKNYTIDEVAEILGRKPSEVRRFIESGVIVAEPADDREDLRVSEVSLAFYEATHGVIGRKPETFVRMLESLFTS